MLFWNRDNFLLLFIYFSSLTPSLCQVVEGLLELPGLRCLGHFPSREVHLCLLLFCPLPPLPTAWSLPRLTFGGVGRETTGPEFPTSTFFTTFRRHWVPLHYDTHQSSLPTYVVAPPTQTRTVMSLQRRKTPHTLVPSSLFPFGSPVPRPLGSPPCLHCVLPRRREEVSLEGDRSVPLSKETEGRSPEVGSRPGVGVTG